MRSLRNHSAELLARVASGESLTVTRDGQAVAILGPVPQRPLAADVLLARFKALPPVDGAAMRAEIDEILDPAL